MSTMFLPDVSGAEGPLYRALADRICEAVDCGEIAPGERLPPVRDLAWRMKCSPGAVARAYKLATDRGALEATVGRGTFARTAPEPGAIARGGARRFALDALVGERPEICCPIDLRGNRAVDVGQDRELTAALERLIARNGGALPLTHYRQREDDPEAAEALAEWLRAGGQPAEAERLLVTPGAQSGAVACLSLLTRGGAGLVLTEPTLHPGLKDAAAALGLRLEPVAADEEGVLPDALDAACAKLRPDALALTATLQNPTLATMSRGRREAVAEVLRRRALPVIEDDVYGRLLDAPPPSFASLTPELCWYVSSLSKCVAAGLRAGLILTPPGRALATLRAHQALAHGTPYLVKALAGELVASGDAERVRARVAEETRARAALAAEVLGPFGARTHPAASFAHLPLAEPWSSAEFAAAAAQADVLVAPRAAYQVGRAHVGDFVRIALGARVGREALEEGFRRLARILRDGPQPGATIT